MQNRNQMKITSCNFTGTIINGTSYGSGFLAASFSDETVIILYCYATGTFTGVVTCLIL